MSAFSVVDEIHLGFAFLVLLCAIVIGWVQLGRRVMVTLIGIQILLGIANTALLGAGAAAMGGRLVQHIVGALVAMFCYIAGRRLAERPAARGWATVASAVGLIVLLATAALGLQMHGRLP